MNSSGINPTGHMVVVKMEKAEEKIGSIHIPEQVRARDDLASQKGVLVAVGPTSGDFIEWPAGASFPPVGSRVVLKKFAGSGCELRGNDGLDYRVCEDKDILAALEG